MCYSCLAFIHLAAAEESARDGSISSICFFPVFAFHIVVVVVCFSNSMGPGTQAAGTQPVRVCVRYSCCAPHGWTVCTVWWWNTCTENRPYIVHICLLLLVDASAKSADSFRFVRAHNSFSPYFSRAPWTTRCRMNLSVYESMSVWSWRDS